MTIDKARKWHTYTVNFFCYRIWEEISMYNHVTNDWGDREHLMPIEPMHPEVQEHILAYLERWLQERPHTSVVRLTSMFYNFWWFWGDPQKQRFIVNDWGSYEFTVNPLRDPEVRGAATAIGRRRRTSSTPASTTTPTRYRPGSTATGWTSSTPSWSSSAASAST